MCADTAVEDVWIAILGHDVVLACCVRCVRDVSSSVVGVAWGCPGGVFGASEALAEDILDCLSLFSGVAIGCSLQDEFEICLI